MCSPATTTRRMIALGHVMSSRTIPAFNSAHGLAKGGTGETEVLAGAIRDPVKGMNWIPALRYASAGMTI